MTSRPCIQDTLSSRARLALRPLGRVCARAKVSCIQLPAYAEMTPRMYALSLCLRAHLAYRPFAREDRVSCIQTPRGVISA